MRKWKFLPALILVLTMVCTGCGSLFSDQSIVKFGDTYTHKDPKDLTYDERVVLQGEDFGKKLQSAVNESAYPDTMMYDKDGNVIGMYDYDGTTGLAAGWTNIDDGTYTAFEAGKEVDLGKPDASKMIEIPGTVTAGFVVYGNKGTAVAAYMYLFLSDASAKDMVKSGMESVYGVTMTEESDTVLTCVQDEAYISDQFAQDEAQGYTVDTKDASAYAEILKQIYGVTEYGGENPYKPYADHQDPDDVEFDDCVVMTGSGEAAVDEAYKSDISSMTDYVYGYKGDVVAQYTYFECPSKEAADTIQEKCYTNAERISDTVLLNVVKGQDMQDTVKAYEGYNVLKDGSLDEYVRMLQETFFTTIYK